MLAISFQRAGTHPVGVGVRPSETADVGGPQIIGRLAPGDPFGKRHAGAAAGGDAKSVETCADEDIGQFGCFAEDEITVGRETLGSVQQLLDTGFLQFRHAWQGQFDELFEMVEVGIQQLEIERIGYAFRGPGDAVRLVTAHDEAADLFLVVGQAIRIAQCRQI